MKLTRPAARALVILKTHGPQRAREFAKKMWPDSPGWKRHNACSRHSIMGASMWLKGGQYLNYLGRKGWVRYEWARREDPSKRANTFFLTDAGNEAIKGHFKAIRENENSSGSAPSR